MQVPADQRRAHRVVIRDRAVSLRSGTGRPQPRRPAHLGLRDIPRQPRRLPGQRPTHRTTGRGSPRLRLRPLPRRPHRLAHTPDELTRCSTSRSKLRTGLHVVDLRTARCRMEFSDSGAVVYMLRRVPTDHHSGRSSAGSGRVDEVERLHDRRGQTWFTAGRQHADPAYQCRLRDRPDVVGADG